VADVLLHRFLSDFLPETLSALLTSLSACATLPASADTVPSRMRDRVFGEVESQLRTLTADYHRCFVRAPEMLPTAIAALKVVLPTRMRSCLSDKTNNSSF
jgi:hypothetical protein